MFIEKKPIVKRGNSNMYLDLPKWMVYGLDWSKQDGKQEKIAIEIIAIPELGEIILRNPGTNGLKSEEFIQRAIFLKGRNAVKSNFAMPNKMQSVAEITQERAKEDQFITLLEEQVKHHETQKQQLLELIESMKSIQATRLSPEKEAQRRQAIAEIDKDKSKQYFIKGEEKSKAMRKFKKLASKKQIKTKK